MRDPATARLHPRITALLRRVEIGLPELRARVDGEEVSAESAAELRGRLAARLYSTLHSGEPPSADGPRPRTLRDTRMERPLREAVPHRSASSPARIAAPVRDGDGHAVVLLSDVRVRIPRTAVARPGELHPGMSVDVALPASRALLSPGFFLADGSRGAALGASEVARLFVHITSPGAAPTIWRSVLEALEERALHYRAKVLSARDAFPRRDALVVYTAEADASALDAVAAQITGMPGIGSETSPFARPLAPGIARASEPADGRPGHRGLSFGQHRSRALAEGLITHASAPERRTREAAVAEAFTAAGIDPTDPSRNLTAPTTPQTHPDTGKEPQ
ncbi:hypothetical protein J0910_30305 [Nocardiopsis sp. CNT-189]|uniref:T3SS effector HopA1 family protein n=1 Tax=Nocardiopsis oceanisediminis TaxID=2816862 RepID=UPI003B3783D0